MNRRDKMHRNAVAGFEHITKKFYY